MVLRERIKPLAGKIVVVLGALDKDGDGTLDLAEVKDAASTVFDRLDKDGDTTLDRKEIGERIGKKEFKSAILRWA